MKPPRPFESVPIVLLILLAGAGGCVAPAARSPEGTVDQARRDSAAGLFEKAESDLSRFISSRAGRDNVVLARAYRARGDARIGLKRFSLAHSDYDSAGRIAKSLGSAFPQGSDFVLECSIAKADTLMLEGFPRLADNEYAALVSRHPPTRYRDALLYRRYICARNEGWRDPEQYVRQIADMRGFDAAELQQRFLKTAGTRGPAPPAAASTARSTATAGRLIVIPRTEWGAAPARINVSPMTSIERITVHHTADVWDTEDFAATADKIRFYQRIHQDDRGWADLGYHFLIDHSGRIWEGRSLRYQGAHAGNTELNRGNIGITLLGDFDVQELTPAQKATVSALLAALCREYGLASRDVFTHQELKGTECPGRSLQRFVDDWRRSSLP